MQYQYNGGFARPVRPDYMIYFNRKIPIMGVNSLSRLCIITVACKTWPSPTGPRFSNSSMILIYWTDSARQTRTIWLISSPFKTSSNFKKQIFPPSNTSPIKLNLSLSLMPKSFRPWVLEQKQIKASIVLWIISKVVFLRNCSQIRMYYPKCKVSFQLSKATVVTRRICSLSQIPINPKVKTTSYTPLQ